MMVVKEGSHNSFTLTAGEDMRLRSIVKQNMYYGESYNTKYNSNTGICAPKVKGSLV